MPSAPADFSAGTISPLASRTCRAHNRSSSLRIRSRKSSFKLAGAGIKPEPLPIDVKVVIIGTRYVYDLLFRYDHDFPKIFKVLADFETDTWVTYTRVGAEKRGLAVVSRGEEVLQTIETDLNIPHNYVLWVEIDGDDAWVGTSKGLGWARGRGYYPGLAEK